MSESIKDQPEQWHRLRRRVIHRGHIVTMEEHDLVSPSGETLTRELIRHHGAVAIMALNDKNEIAVVHQYRHPVASRLVEPPAGLLDVDAEEPLAAAQRELAEEAGLAAGDWRVLADYCTSPGVSDEVARIYLARELSPVDRPAGYVAHGEEADMGLDWLPLDDVMDAIRDGTVNNVALVLGVTSLCLALVENRLDSLRPGDAAWTMHQHVVIEPRHD